MPVCENTHTHTKKMKVFVRHCSTFFFFAELRFQLKAEKSCILCQETLDICNQVWHESRPKTLVIPKINQFIFSLFLKMFFFFFFLPLLPPFMINYLFQSIHVWIHI